jgi:TRAP-type C4-dicarboxylate transport system permease small subunit
MRRINTAFDKVLFWLTALSAISFFLVVIISIVTRYIPRIQFHSSIELSRLLFVWSCFLAAAMTYRQKAHVGFGLLFEKFSKRTQKHLTVFMHAVIIVFLIIVFYQSLLTCHLLWPTVLPILGISQAWFYVPVPVLCVFLLSFTIEWLIDEFKLNPETGI